MILRRSNVPKLQNLQPPPPDLSPSWAPQVLSDCDADDEDTMSTDDNVPSRPLSVAQSHFEAPAFASTATARLPTLHEILANVSAPPYSLSAFTAYLSQNHCLETLEFTTDAARYCLAYQRLYDQIHASNADADAIAHVRMLWQRLLAAYVAPNAPREVNLPAFDRDALLSMPSHSEPPPPEALTAATRRIYDLMNDSVLLPFLHDASPRPPPTPALLPPVRSFTDSSDDMRDAPARSRTGADSPDGARSASANAGLRSRSRRKVSPPMSLQGPPPSTHHVLASPPAPLSPSALSDFDFAPFSGNTSATNSTSSSPAASRTSMRVTLAPSPSPPAPITSGILTHAHPPERMAVLASPQAQAAAATSLPLLHHGRTTTPASTSSASGTSLTSGGSGSGTSGGAEPMLTDDSGGASSPGKDPWTPPTTPPASERGGESPRRGGISGAAGSPTGGSMGGVDNAWRKMIGRLGARNKSASRAGREEGSR